MSNHSLDRETAAISITATVDIASRQPGTTEGKHDPATPKDNPESSPPKGGRPLHRIKEESCHAER